jgi:uncharacterized membrane protein
MRLEKRLEEWRDKGLISAEQAVKIHQYEADSRTSGRWVVWGLAAVGAIAVGAGVISLVAANWQELGDAAKLGLGLTLVLGCAAGALSLGEKADGWPRDLFLLLHQGLVLAMIGLVAQVYHLSGHPWRAYALAAALGLPAALAARRAAPADAVLALALVALGYGFDEAHLWEQLTRHDFQLALVGGALSLGFVSLARPVGAVGFEGPAQALRRWASGLGFVTLFFSAMMWSEKAHRSWFGEHLPDVPTWPVLWFLASLVVAALLYLRPKPDLPRVLTGALGTLLVLGAAFGWLPEDTGLRKVVGFALAVGFCAAYTFAAAAAGSRRGVNAATLALAARVLVLFFELFEDLTRTGLGLIVTGLLLCAVAWAWWRMRVLVPIAPRPTAPGGAA